MKLDLSNRNLKKLDLTLLKQNLNALNTNESHEISDFSIEAACFDNNHLSKLENLGQFVNLKNVIFLFQNVSNRKNKTINQRKILNSLKVIVGK